MKKILMMLALSLMVTGCSAPTEDGEEVNPVEDAETETPETEEDADAETETPETEEDAEEDEKDNE